MPDNLTRLEAWTEAQIALAAGKTPREAEAFISEWAQWLNSQAYALGTECCPKRLRGLTALDLANARDRLVSTVPMRTAPALLPLGAHVLHTPTGHVGTITDAWLEGERVPSYVVRFGDMEARIGGAGLVEISEREAA